MTHARAQGGQGYTGLGVKGFVRGQEKHKKFRKGVLRVTTNVL